MPKGQKTITWDAANSDHFWLSILAVHNDLRIDAASVAQVFGNNIAPSVIMTRLGTLKAKARALNSGVVPTNVAVAPSATKRSRVTKKANGGTAYKKIKKESVQEGQQENGDEAIGAVVDDGHDQAVTPPATPAKKATNTSTGSSKLATPSPEANNGAINSHIQSKRCSPRDSAKQDYRKLDDPFVYLKEGVGGDGSNVFGQATDSESVDSVDSDKDFGGEEVSTEA